MSDSKPTRRAPEGSGLIFIVDDNAVLVDFASTVLKGKGYAVQSFTDPQAVLEAMRLADPKPNALVTDYDMGEMNGLDLIVHAHVIHPKLTTILLSGTVTDTFISTHPAKVHGFIGKPYRAAQLQDMLRDLLAASAQAEP